MAGFWATFYGLYNSRKFIKNKQNNLIKQVNKSNLIWYDEKLWKNWFKVLEIYKEGIRYNSGVFNYDIYIKWSESERTVKKYWGNTNKIKILYKFYGNDVIIDAFSLEGKTIFSYSRTGFFLDFKNPRTHLQV